MMRLFYALLIHISLSLATPEGKILFENNCLRCHREGSLKPVSFLKKKFKGNPEGIVEMAKRCPWGKGLSNMEIKLIAEWLSK